MQHIFSLIIAKTNYAESKYGTLLFCLGISLLWIFHGWYEFTEIPMRIYWSYASYVSELYILLFFLRLILLFPKHPVYVVGSFFILAILFVCFRHSGNHVPFDLFLAIAASRHTNHRRISLIYGLTMGFAIVLGPLFYGLGMASDVVKHIGTSVGHSWGINNPNVLAEMFMCVLFAVLCYFKINRSRYVLISCWAVALVVWFITLCRSVSIALALFPLLYYFILKKKSVRGLVFWPVAMLVISVLLALYFGPVEGNTTLISRFSIPYYMYEQYGLSWLGDGAIADSQIHIDNYLIHYFLNNGILVGILLLMMYSVLLHRIGKRKNHLLLISMICCVTFFGFFSIMPLDIKRNFMLLFFFNDEEEVG